MNNINNFSIITLILSAGLLAAAILSSLIHLIERLKKKKLSKKWHLSYYLILILSFLIYIAGFIVSILYSIRA